MSSAAGRGGGWELVTRWPGGAVTALVTATGPDTQTVTLAATPAGLHRSEDGGLSWRWVALGPDPTPECLAVVGQAAAGGCVLLGAGSGLYRSTDGGQSWQPALVGSRVQCLAARGTSDTGVVLAGTEADGVLRSEDGGQSWSGANAGLIDLNVTALALSPAFERDRTAFAGTASGLFRSRNGGRAWRLVELGPEAPVVQAVAVSPAFSDDGLALAGTESDGLFRSEDGGQTWEPVSEFPGPCVTVLAFTRDGRTVIAGTAAGVARSSDGGLTWNAEAPDLGPILSMTVAPDGATVAGTIERGAVRQTADSGWQPSDDGLTGRATVGLAATMAFGDEPLLGVATLDAGVLISHDAGRSWKTGHGGLSTLAATALAFVRRADGQPALLATFADGLYRTSEIEAGWQPVDLSMLGLPERARPTCLAVVGDLASGPTRVLAAGPRCLLLSDDAGDRWRTLPLPTPAAEIVQVAASPDPPRDGTMYVAVRATRTERDGSEVFDGLELWRTDSLGLRWSRWLHDPQASVMPIAVSRAGDLPSSVLVGRTGGVAQPRPQTAERRGGETRPLWQEAPIGEPSDVITAVAFSPHVRQDRRVLAAGGGTPYLSRDGGATFAAWDGGIQTPLVTGLSVVALGDGQVAAYALGLGGTLWRRTLA